MSDPLQHLKELNANYTELWKKIIRRYDFYSEQEQTDLINQFKLIKNKINKLNLQIEKMLIELDSCSFNLSQREQDRIQNTEEIERVIDRIKPMMLISLMLERGDFDNNILNQDLDTDLILFDSN